MRFARNWRVSTGRSPDIAWEQYALHKVSCIKRTDVDASLEPKLSMKSPLTSDQNRKDCDGLG
jgi:hypothetical protein